MKADRERISGAMYKVALLTLLKNAAVYVAFLSFKNVTSKS